MLVRLGRVREAVDYGLQIIADQRRLIPRNGPDRSIASKQPCSIGQGYGAAWRSRVDSRWPPSMLSCAMRFTMTRPITWGASGSWCGGARGASSARSTWVTSIHSEAVAVQASTWLG